MNDSVNNIDAYFSHIVSILGRTNEEIVCIATAHMVPNTLQFMPAINRFIKLASVLAKPKSIGRSEFEVIKDQFNTHVLSREWANDANKVLSFLYDLNLRGKKIIFIDIGGYFSNSINQIADSFNGEILGILEGTENGVCKYEENFPYKVPVITVARSPLKLPEDYLVASSIVFSIEAVLREQTEILQTRSAAVIGYGRVGSSIAEILRSRGINTVVYDTNPIKLAEAAAKGFQACRDRSKAIQQSSLVVCATGNKALDLAGFGGVRSGTVIASVTSADDELDLSSLSEGYIEEKISNNLTRYTENRQGKRYFDLVAGGNAANFLHGAVIGPAIQLIEGEKLFAIQDLINRKTPKSENKVFELDHESRNIVATIWNEHFLV